MLEPQHSPTEIAGIVFTGPEFDNLTKAPCSCIFSDGPYPFDLHPGIAVLFAARVGIILS